MLVLAAISGMISTEKYFPWRVIEGVNNPIAPQRARFQKAGGAIIGYDPVAPDQSGLSDPWR